MRGPGTGLAKMWGLSTYILRTSIAQKVFYPSNIRQMFTKAYSGDGIGANGGPAIWGHALYKGSNKHKCE